MRLTGLVLVALSNILPKVPANPIINRGGNLVTFMWWGTQSQDICWRPNPGYAEIENTVVPCCQKWATQQLPTGWRGNFWAMTQGNCQLPAGADQGVIGEITFQGGTSNDQTFYDVSSIDSNSTLGIHWIYPTSHFAAIRGGSWSGCVTFGCDTAYAHWNDTRTLVTPETSLNVLMGSGIQVNGQLLSPPS